MTESAATIFTPHTRRSDPSRHILDAALSTINRLRLGEETQQDMQAELIVLALEARMGDARHDGELFIRIGQQLEELDEIVDASDTIPLAPHDNGSGLDPGRVYHRQVCAHVDIGAG